MDVTRRKGILCLSAGRLASRLAGWVRKVSRAEQMDGRMDRLGIPVV